MKLRGDFWFFIVIIALVLVMIIMAARMDWLSAKLLPLMIGSVVLVLAATGAIREIMTMTKDQASSAGAGRSSGETKGILRQYLPIWTWVGGFVLAIYLVGFMISIPVFVLSYMKVNGVRWHTAIFSTFLVTSVIYGLFEVLLRADLYGGVLLTW